MWNLFVKSEIQKERQSICNKCEFKTDRWLIVFEEDACSICKCSIPKKTKLKISKCPKKKW
jgi:hypothetical protein